VVSGPVVDDDDDNGDGDGDGDAAATTTTNAAANADDGHHHDTGNNDGNRRQQEGDVEMPPPPLSKQWKLAFTAEGKEAALGKVTEVLQIDHILLYLICVAFYVAVFVFVQVAAVFFQLKYDISKADASHQVQGGAVYISNGGKGTFTNCNFTSNEGYVSLEEDHVDGCM
jgi:hypothetical protein